MLESTIDTWDAPPDPPIAGETIPAGLGTMEPGPVLGAFLASIDLHDLSGLDRLIVLQAMERQVSHDQARFLETMASVVDSVVEEYEEDLDHPMGLARAAEGAGTEIRVALHLTRRAADRELEFALDLHLRLPQVREAFRSGTLDRRRAGVIVRETVHLTIAEARSIADQVLPDAPVMTTGQLRARIQRLCMGTDPDQARRRYDTAVADRRVVAEPTSDGTAHLMGFDLPPDRVGEIRERIETIARSLRGSGETRTMDQLRADVYIDLLRGTDRQTDTTGEHRGVIDLRVDVETLTELADMPGDLGGYGPIVADLARRVAREHPEAEWQYSVTDPHDGRVVAAGVTRRRPTTVERRTIQRRDGTCVFPGCRRPARRSDLDHRVPFSEGGETTVDEMAPLCRPDHCVKHAFGWTYRRLPDGAYEWTSPLGLITTVGAGARSP